MDTNMYMAEQSSSLLGDIFGFGFIITCLVMSVLYLIVFCKLFSKAGYTWWHAIVPFYSNYKYSMMTFGSIVPFILLFVPVVNYIVIFAMYYKTAIVFGKSTIFGIATVFFPYICLPILAFGNAEYIGSNGEYEYDNEDYYNSYYQDNDNNNYY